MWSGRSSISSCHLPSLGGRSWPSFATPGPHDGHGAGSGARFGRLGGAEPGAASVSPSPRKNRAGGRLKFPGSWIQRQGPGPRPPRAPRRPRAARGDRMLLAPWHRHSHIAAPGGPRPQAALGRLRAGDPPGARAHSGPRAAPPLALAARRGAEIRPLAANLKALGCWRAAGRSRRGDNKMRTPHRRHVTMLAFECRRSSVASSRSILGNAPAGGATGRQPRGPKTGNGLPV